MTEVSRAEVLWRELERFIDIVVSELHPQQIVVFGSLARGTIQEWSDLDIVVVMKTDLPFFDRMRLIQRRVHSEVAMDVLVYTPEEWAEVKETRPFVRDEIAAKGRIIYDRPGTTLA